MNIILLGPPGAGKGTQAKVMAKRIGLPHISTGDLLRHNVSSGTELGKEAVGFMNRGLLVPDGLVTSMLLSRIGEQDALAGFILDGYPRNISQAEALDDFLKQKNKNIDMVFYLETSESVIIQRLSGRLVCSVCNANFHIKNMPPERNMICDNCAGLLYQRTDDKEETIKKRLEVYGKEVTPLIQYYEERGKLRRVLADEDAEVVLNKIIELIEEYNDTLKV